MSLEDHKALGERIRRASAEMRRLSVLLGDYYPLSVASKAARAHDAIGRLQCDLDGRLFEEFPELGHHEKVEIYYGPDPEEKALEE